MIRDKDALTARSDCIECILFWSSHAIAPARRQARHRTRHDARRALRVPHPFPARCRGDQGRAARGDPTRALVRGGPSGTFIAYSHGKKSVCLDLANPEGHAAFLRLLAGADALVHNLAPRAARKLKL